MQQYVGTKIIKAEPMTRGEYNQYRGWQIPKNENPADEGYHIVYSMAMRHGFRRNNLTRYTGESEI